MPRRVASSTAERLPSGNCQRLSSSVPSMSRAIRRMGIVQLYPEIASFFACPKGRECSEWCVRMAGEMGTKRLYYDEPALRQFDAQVLSCKPFTATASAPDRKSTRLNSSHSSISYAVFCLKKKINIINDAVAAKISTGAVVARPASVMRDLLANSLNASAPRLRLPLDAVDWTLILLAADRP